MKEWAVRIKEPPGWQMVELKNNLYSPCGVCKKRPQIVYWKLSPDRRSIIRCGDHARD